MSRTNQKVHALEVNASMIGALFTDRAGDRLRVFCFYLNGDTGQFDVPAEANRDSLHHLFSKLDMVGQCTSFILEKVVRGRLYVERDEKLECYTLLATPGDSLPPLNADICDLPWKSVWAGQEVEVLRLASTRRGARCFAIRSQVRDMDADALYRSSNAFVNPHSITQNASEHSAVLRNVVTAALLVVAVSLGWLVGYNTERDSATPHVSARAVENTVAIAETKVQMISDRTITGPFAMAELAQMNKEGKLPSDSLFRLDGGTDWVPLLELPWGTTNFSIKQP
jgi:hypothetical protein